MRGNASTAEQSSIGQSPTIEETASRPKPRKPLKQPPWNKPASKRRNFGIASVEFDNEQTGVLGYVQGVTASELLTLIRTSRRSLILIVFSFLPIAVSRRSNNLQTWQSKRLCVAS